MSLILPFDPEISRASTIPSRLYVDPVYRELEEERVSGRTWQCVVTFTGEIQEEDMAICAQVQKNLRSRSCDRVRYSPQHENGVHHFHSLLHEFLT